MGLRRVHHLLADEVVLDLVDRRGAGVAHLPADREVFEPRRVPGQRRERAGHDATPARMATKFVRSKSTTGSPRWFVASVCHVTVPLPGRLFDSRFAVTVDRAVMVSPG